MKKRLSNKSVDYVQYLALGIISILALLVRAINITKSSIWHDEGFSVMLALRNPIQIWQGSARDVHPPFYYELLHCWMKLFGSSAIAVRSLSLMAGVLAVIVGFMVVKSISTKRAAIISALFLALAPIMVRYSQEARMYGLLTLLMLIALYAVINIVKKPNQIWPYVLYTLSIGLGLYTHYFTALAVISLWFYLVLLQSPKKWQLNKTIFLSLKWWLANIVALLLFLPWLGNMVAQLTRGQGLGWLGKTNIYSLGSALWQFVSFTDGKQLPMLLWWAVVIIVIGASIYIVIKDESKQKFNLLIVIYSLLPIFLALAVSTFKPVFHERYFVFSAAGIFIILALAIDKASNARQWLLYALVFGVIIVEVIGVRNVYAQSNHQMQNVLSNLNTQAKSGDIVIAGELYVFFDGSYYNKSNLPIKLYTANSNLNGYGESGLLYDQNVYLNSYSTVPAGSRVWLIGKTGNQQYYNQVPPNWQLQQQVQAGYSELRLYQVK